jgi:hypothetical protein
MYAGRYRLNISDGGPGDIDEIILSDGGVVGDPIYRIGSRSIYLGYARRRRCIAGKS